MRSLSKAYPKTTKSPCATLAEAKEKLSHFCSFQERSLKQINQKMKTLGVQAEWCEQILESLIAEGYLNESRFTKSFVRGKSQGRGWGPQKIAFRLRMEGIGQNEIVETLKETDWQKAENKLKEAILKKKAELDKKQDPNWNSKLLRFSLSRGFEFDYAQKLIKDLFPD